LFEQVFGPDFLLDFAPQIMTFFNRIFQPDFCEPEFAQPDFLTGFCSTGILNAQNPSPERGSMRGFGMATGFMPT
jgi:hypothetical protein